MLLLPFADLATPSAGASTATRISWKLDPAYLYAIGVDHVTAAGSPGGYENLYEYPGSTFLNNPVMRNPLLVSDKATLTQIRMEFYQRCKLLKPNDFHLCTSGTNQYGLGQAGDAGVAVRITPAANVDIGRVLFPKPTDANFGLLNLRFVSRSAIPDSRLKITIFQTTGEPRTNTGTTLDAFAHGWNTGTAWKSTGLWNGRYLAFIYDYANPANPRRVLGFFQVRGTTNVTVDLDATCMGIDECHTLQPTGPVDGEFHPVANTRIVDTRRGLGIPAIVTPGDGRLADPNPIHRLATRLDHEFRVGGLAGVPTAGVSAVLLNVTVLGGTAAGSMALITKPPHTGSIFEDQASFNAFSTASSQVYWNKGDTVTSQVLVRVGTGGKIRVHNRSFGDAHLLVDVVGWFDESQPLQNGLGLTPTAPVRVFDSRSGIGTTVGVMEPRQVRTASLAKQATNALPQVAVASASVTPLGVSSFITLWPAGGVRPNTATVSATPPQPRANMVTVPLSKAGTWSIFNGPAHANVSIDLEGWFAAQTGAHGRVTVIDPTVLARQAIGANSNTRLLVSGKARVPGKGVSGVYLNVTMSSATSTGTLTIDTTARLPISTVHLRYAAQRTSANLVLAPLASDGTVLVRNVGKSGGTLTVEVVGYVTT